MEITREKVLEVLGSILEPDLKKDLVSANLVEELAIDGTTITLKVFVSNPALHARKRMQEAIDFNLKRTFGDNITVVSTVVGLPAEAKSAQRKILPEVKHIVAIASGKGGVGKSTVATNLALALREYGQVGLLDADIYGPSIPRMMGSVNQKLMINSNQQIMPLERMGIKLMSIGFLVEENAAVVWRGPMLFKAMDQFFKDVQW